MAPPTRRRWGDAIQATRQLVRNPDQTELAFRVFDAIDPDQYEHALARVRSCEAGRQLLRDRPRLLDALSDHEALRKLPERSFGRAYLDHMERYGLDPKKLVALGQSTERWKDSSDEARWVAERSQLTHDLWHVLAGYGADEPGEAALLVFSLAQVGTWSNVVLAIGANARVLSARGPGWIRELRSAWRRGRRARDLSVLRYEALLPRPLDEVRATAGLSEVAAV